MAAILCCIGIKAAVRLMEHSLAARGVVKAGWTFLAAMVAGTSVWTTHFIGILAFHAPVRGDFDPALTILSLLIAVGGAYGALTVANLERSGAWPAIGGGLLGLVIAAMHYIGMAGYNLNCGVEWNRNLVWGSILPATAMTALALAALRGQAGTRIGASAATVFIVAAILSLHFVGMYAMAIVMPHAGLGAAPAQSPALALVTALAGGLIIVAGSFAYMVDADTREEAQKQIAALALIDVLTGFPNRAAFDATVRARVDQAIPDARFAIIAMGVANFGSIVQQYGAGIAEMVLQATAHRLTAAKKLGVFLARTGNAQFCGIGPVLDRDDTWQRSLKLRAALSEDLLIAGRYISVDIRVGCAIYPSDTDEADPLVRMAQTALARAAADPLQPIALHDDATDASAQRRVLLANDLRGALDRGEFELFYQPQVWIADRHVIGYEALLRWRHPDLGMISPAEFIPLAESSGCIVDMGAWVLRTACETAAGWDDACRVAVNVSPLQLRQRDLTELIGTTLASSGLAASRLEIELTESLLIDDRDNALRTLGQIKALGVKLALDDFGTGYSSMDVLRHFPFDKVKLDKSFVDDIETSPQARAILHAMLALGRALCIPILVEGVESERQLAILRKEGCNKVQGYLTGRPMRASEIGKQAPQGLSKGRPRHRPLCGGTVLPESDFHGRGHERPVSPTRP